MPEDDPAALLAALQLGRQALDWSILLGAIGFVIYLLLAAAFQPRPEPEASPEQLAEAAAWDAEWNRGHDALAALSTRGINARVPGASHTQLEQCL